MKTYTCLNCGVVNPFKGHSYSHKYCNNKCQKEHGTRDRIRQWLEEGKDWKFNIPTWAKTTIAEQRGDCCEVCGIKEWNGLSLALECDHIDGNHTNNKIDNLRLICPNCHSQTSTYKNRNKGSGRTYRTK